MTEIACPQCGLPAQMLDRFSLPSTDGWIEHVRLRCSSGHALTPLVEHLEPRVRRAVAGAPVARPRLRLSS